MASYGGGEEIRLALDDFVKLILDLAKTDLSTATRIQGVVWVAARDIEIFADLVTSERFHEINRPTVEVIDTGPRRHGTEIFAGSAIAFPLLVLSRWQWRDLRARHLNTGFQSTKHAAWSGRASTAGMKRF